MAMLAMTITISGDSRNKFSDLISGKLSAIR
jgi:hypothetical protein